MSLSIDVNRVASVLLPDGKWHEVVDHSFTTDAYEYLHDGDLIFGGGTEDTIPATGATWIERDPESGNQRVVFCPLTSIQAVAYDAERATTTKKRR